MAFKIVILAGCLCFVACSREKRYPTPEEVPGIYVNTYKVDVVDPADGELMGSRTVADTIFIRRTDQGFEITNHKWLYNDYDGKGWVDSMQGEIEPMQTYVAVFDTKIGTLSPSVKGTHPRLFLEDERVFWGEFRALEYLKVDN
jgi:hypothetical protein